MFYYTNSLGGSENPNFPLFLDKKSPFYGLIIGARYRNLTSQLRCSQETHGFLSPLAKLGAVFLHEEISLKFPRPPFMFESYTEYLKHNCVFIGARYRIRTYDPCNVNAVLYHWANRA